MSRPEREAGPSPYLGEGFVVCYNISEEQAPGEIVIDHDSENNAEFRPGPFHSSAAVRPASGDGFGPLMLPQRPALNEATGDSVPFLHRTVPLESEGAAVEGAPHWPELPAMCSHDPEDEMLAALRQRDRLKRLEIEQKGTVWSG